MQASREDLICLSVLSQASVDITCPSGEAGGVVMAVVMTCSSPVKKAVKAKLGKTRGRAACASYSNAALPKDQILPVEAMVKEAPSQGRACSKVPAATEPGSDRNAVCEDVASNIRLRVLDFLINPDQPGFMEYQTMRHILRRLKNCLICGERLQEPRILLA
ncbi:hypothetical protein NDU88_005987 [Pleurodeles waltl]|uniref:Uncharacterized protein n=1 Tax=Pleurodeles waltl TaxID=8319 RepID=A0AAV7QHP5_PLEWA|nr:hypothetical protein NDU88_005987 [Pleurodeles waltl]